MTDQKDTVSFTYSPHVLVDLGVNLYTSIEKALVEFVANAHDADSPEIDISFDSLAIEHATEQLKADFKMEKKRSGPAYIEPLEERTLPEKIQIVIEDKGCGMTRQDLEKKFLVIGRRRREEKGASQRTPKGRIIMGRKGLGKLAGFGIAHTIEVISKVKDESHATKITLDLDRLLKTEHDTAAERATRQIEVEKLLDGAGLAPEGTRIILKRLVHEAVSGDLLDNLKEALADNFYGIRSEDFSMKLNGEIVSTARSDFAFAYPEPERPLDDLVESTLEVDPETQTKITFQYRIRFTPPTQQLKAKARGFRVYAHNRLASAPDLLNVKSSAHGFQYTSYLDGVLVADFIDDQRTDYISTDRQTLRWEAPMLVLLKQFLTSEMTRALAKYADHVSEKIDNTIKSDPFTADAITNGGLPAHRQGYAWKIAKVLAGKDSGNLQSQDYQHTLRTIVSGMGQGEILATIAKLAEQDEPPLTDVIREISRLTRQEFDEFITSIEARIQAIETLSKLVEGVDFKKNKNEKALHTLFHENPWLIDPTFFEFLTSDEEETVLADRLMQHLSIGKHVPPGYDPAVSTEANPLESNLRPDLTFLLMNEPLNRVVIVELKAPNTPLHVEHLTQLEGYIADTHNFLENQNRQDFKVEGYLIGSLEPKSTSSKKVTHLRHKMKQDMGPNSRWRVFDIAEVLDRTKSAHHELWNAYKRAKLAGKTD